MFISLNKGTKDFCVQFSFSILLFSSLFSDANARSDQVKNYFRIEQNKLSEKNDLKISSIGGLGFKDNTEGHIELSYLESDIHGNELALNLGGGYVFNWEVSLFIGLGISLGYNQDKSELIGAYYPQAGLVWDIAETFGITVSAKRFYKRYEENVDIVMIGLVFRG